MDAIRQSHRYPDEYLYRLPQRSGGGFIVDYFTSAWIELTGSFPLTEPVWTIDMSSPPRQAIVGIMAVFAQLRVELPAEAWRIVADGAAMGSP